MKLDEVIKKYTKERNRIKRECEWDLMYPGGMSERYSILNEVLDDLNFIDGV